MAAKSLWLAGIAAIALALTACGKKDAAEDKTAAAAAESAAGEEADSAAILPGPAVDAKLAAENRAASDTFLAENGAREGVKTTPSGLQYEVLSEGPAGGASPKPTDFVEVHYVGTLIDGVEFDSSRARGAAAFFPLEVALKGWIEGVELMHVGDRYRLFLPPELAFGETGTPGGPIGPNQAVIFDVELLKVVDPADNAAASEKFLNANAKRPGVKITESGLQYEVLAEGSAEGKSPTDADLVVAHYRGTLIDGTEFDSSYARGKPAEFALARVIRGWTEGLQLMSEGDKFRFVVPSNLAYGEPGRPDSPIGPNEALVFEVELIEVK
jgi:peptidylprolyl isomerase